MSNMRNFVHLIGRLGAKPEGKTISNGRRKATFSLATEDAYTDEKGNRVTETTWHNLVAFGKTAEIAEKYLEKGKEIAVQGKINNRSYEDKDGVKKYISEVLVNEFLMVGGKREQE